MIESIQLCYQKTDCDCLKKRIATSLSFVRAAKEENLRDIRGHQALAYASNFLSKKYEENRRTVPSPSQLDSYVAEFSRGSYYAGVNAVTY
jgi:hypothetical protein